MGSLVLAGCEVCVAVARQDVNPPIEQPDRPAKETASRLLKIDTTLLIIMQYTPHMDLEKITKHTLF